MGISQKELGELAGISHSMISRIEAGIVPAQPETQETLVKIFTDAGIDTEILMIINEMINNVKGV